VAGKAFEPLVSLSTKMKDNTVEIRVTDNGTGIPETIIDKIFQPFFTTKPTGQGTGLGLSLSYDIITKGYGGELLANNKEAGGVEFIMSFPVIQTQDLN
jgi:signal transduction histidine kinase